MVAIKLREAMEAHRRRTGERMTYKLLAERSGIAKGTLEVIGKRLGYNATVGTLEKICIALHVSFGDLVEIIPEPPKPKKRNASSKRAR